MVYLPTFGLNLWDFHVGKYTVYHGSYGKMRHRISPFEDKNQPTVPHPPEDSHWVFYKPTFIQPTVHPDISMIFHDVVFGKAPALQPMEVDKGRSVCGADKMI